MSEDFIARPTEVYRQYLEYWASNGREGNWWEEGRLAMALEIITVRKSLRSMGVTDTSVLDSLLVDQGLFDQAEELYEVLNEWRRPRFAAVGVDPDTDPPSATVSPLASPGERSPRTLSSPRLPRQDRTTGPSPESRALAIGRGALGLLWGRRSGGRG